MLLERDEVLGTAAAAAAATRAGSGRWILLSAPVAGMGRTAVLETIVRRESGRGAMRVGRARGVAEETAFPFGIVRQLFTDDEAVPFSVPTGMDEQWLFHRLVTRLTRSAAERPVLLVVDDLHHADEPSLRWIGYLARRIAEIPALLVVTECADQPGPVPFPPSTGGAVALRPLSESTVVRLARAADLDRDDTATCVEAGAGNPALVRALIADLGGGPPSGPKSARPHGRYRDTIADWLRKADPCLRHACLALAVAAEGDPPAGPGPDHRLCDLCTSARAPGERPAHHLDALLSHPLARGAVLAAADPEEVAALHARVAELLDESGAPATAVASRLLHVERPGATWMARALSEAAEEAARNGHVAQSAAYLRHALSGTLDPDRRAALTVRLGALELANNPTAGIRRLHTGLELHTDVRERAAAATALSAALVAVRDPDTAMRVLRQAGRAAADDELVQVLQTLGALVASHDNDEWRGAVAGLRALAPTAPPAIEPLVCGLITEYEAGAGLCSAAEALARIRPRLATRVDPRLRTAWFGSAATLLQWADCLDEARELTGLCLPGLSVPPALTDVGVQCLLSVRAEAALWEGAFDRVVAENAPLVEAAGERGVRLPHLSAMVASARYEKGDRAGAWEAVALAGQRGSESSWEWNELSYTRAVLHAADGDWHAALDDYLACGAGQSAHDFVSPVATPWRSGAAFALVRLGRRQEARELAEEELRHARTWGTARTVGRALRAYAAAVGGRLALCSLTEGAELLRPSAAPVELAEVLVDLGRAQIEAGSARKGRDTLREAHAVALRPAPAPASGAAPGAGGPAAVGRLLALTQDALREGGVRSRNGGHALTPAERRVAELAAVGNTNAQISSALCLTLRTVETHLTNSYRKLRIARRSQLVAVLQQ
ncbi:LuxR family transcriptional regulator [Streptomyces sp. BE20]|uniref:helix-turn-helix transcriptional regulator n=1 Tax=unclassified Streptomyces TaxID=2593676 RepID=UPI002E76808D|nr:MULTISPECIES: LuxR family transcriptional regulator [unclassified Streptomyces]MED7951056.1 LuxR family transcriptional regulator [Streptomyces sp. BE303]MEE1821521.1 LuxR family transcriptional regulator [Streptomyces sp. BE20]